MSIQLKTDEMLEIIGAIDVERAAALQKRLEALATEMAQFIGHHFDCEYGDATFEGTAFAGTCAPFNPKRVGQELPECFAHYDEGGDWEAD